MEKLGLEAREGGGNSEMQGCDGVGMTSVSVWDPSGTHGWRFYLKECIKRLDAFRV